MPYIITALVIFSGFFIAGSLFWRAGQKLIEIGTRMEQRNERQCRMEHTPQETLDDGDSWWESDFSD